MEIVTTPEFYPVLKDQNLLLDTNVFIDTSIHPQTFRKFFGQLRDDGVTLVTIDPVRLEFCKGAVDGRSFNEKVEFITSIVDTILPVTKDILDDAISLVRACRVEGKGISVTDFLLGGFLVKYSKRLFLLSKDTNAFPTNVFTLKTFFSLLYPRAIHSYGVYVFDKSAV